MMAIECRMVQLAESDSVGDPCFAELLGVGDDVSGVKQVRMAEEADCAARAIGLQDGRAELALVQSLAHFDDSVLPFDDGSRAARDRHHSEVALCQRRCLKRKRSAILAGHAADDRLVQGLFRPIEVDDGEVLAQALAKFPVVFRIGISPLIAIREEGLVAGDLIIVTALPARPWNGGLDRQRAAPHLHGLEDAAGLVGQGTRSPRNSKPSAIWLHDSTPCRWARPETWLNAAARKSRSVRSAAISVRPG